MKRPTEPKGRFRYLSDKERKKLLKDCQESENSYLYTIVVVAISTGMRHGEIMNLTWDAVDLNRRRIILENTKK